MSMDRAVKSTDLKSVHINILNSMTATFVSPSAGTDLEYIPVGLILLAAALTVNSSFKHLKSVAVVKVGARTRQNFVKLVSPTPVLSDTFLEPPLLLFPAGTLFCGLFCRGSRSVNVVLCVLQCFMIKI